MVSTATRCPAQLTATSVELDLSGPHVRLRTCHQGDLTALERVWHQNLRSPASDDGAQDRTDALDATFRRAVPRPTPGRISLTIEWSGLVCAGLTSAPRCERLVVGLTSMTTPQPVPPADTRRSIVRLGPTILAASVQRSGCLAEARLLMLDHSFDVWGVDLVEIGSSSGTGLPCVDKQHWPLLRETLRTAAERG